MQLTIYLAGNELGHIEIACGGQDVAQELEIAAKNGYTKATVLIDEDRSYCLLREEGSQQWLPWELTLRGLSARVPTRQLLVAILEIFNRFHRIKHVKGQGDVRLLLNEDGSGRLSHPIKETCYIEDDDGLVSEYVDWDTPSKGILLLEKYIEFLNK